MKVKRKTAKNKIQTSKIKNLISFNNIKNPFKNSKESEQFYKTIIEEEMNLSNNYNSSNLNRLLDLYLKGINLYQNTPNTDKVNSFFEKSQLLLQSSKAKKVLNENKEKTPEINEIKTDSTLIEENEESDYNNKNKPYEKTYEQHNNKDEKEDKEDRDNDDEDKDVIDNENKLKFDFEKYQTMRHNEIQNRHRLNYLSNSIKKGIKEKDNQKQKIKEINNQFNKIKEEQLKTSLFLEDEIKKQSNNFQKKLLRKRTMYHKSKNIKLKIDTIQEENIPNDKEKINDVNKKEITKKRNNTPKEKINKNFMKKNDKNKKVKRNSFNYSINNNQSFNIINIKNNNKNIVENSNNINNTKNEKISVNDRLKTKTNKYLEEFNNDIFKYYFTIIMNKISDLAKKKYIKNKKIY